jgi:hypothetical protein
MMHRVSCFCVDAKANAHRKTGSRWIFAVAYDEKQRVTVVYFTGNSLPIIEEIDRVLAQHYGFTDEELDFIINYDIKYRMGRDSGEDEEEMAVRKSKKGCLQALLRGWDDFRPVDSVTIERPRLCPTGACDLDEGE